MTKLERMVGMGAREGVQCLREICADSEQKASDRIAAAKALYEFAGKSESRSQKPVSVVLENVPKEYLA